MKVAVIQKIVRIHHFFLNFYSWFDMIIYNAIGIGQAMADGCRYKRSVNWQSAFYFYIVSGGQFYGCQLQKPLEAVD